jgi:hypothetical protein
MTKFLHIGMPKTLTSALQKEFYSQHDNIYYLGIGNDRLIDYIDEDVNFVFETLLLYANNEYYNKNRRKAIKTINKHFENALKNSKSAFGASLEWLSFNFSPDMIDNSLKVKRLSQLFGKNTKIILFLRNQTDLLKSLYKEYIKVGLPFTFNEFIKYIYNFKDRNFYYNLFYDRHYKLYSKYFKKKNIYLLPLESFRNKDKSLSLKEDKIEMVKEICKIIGIDYPVGLKLSHINPSLNEAETFYKQKLNTKYRHDFGNLIFEHSNIHRSRKYFEYEGSFGINDYFKDVKIKSFLLELAKGKAKEDPKEISYYANPKLLKKLTKEFVEANKNLTEQYNIELPDIYFNMTF